MLKPRIELPPDQYRAIVEVAAVMIWRSDPQGRATYLNEAWERFTGRLASDDLGHKWAGAVHPEDLERCLATFTEHLRDQLPFEMEYRIRRHDGVYRWCLDRGVPYAEDTGAFGGFIGTIVDIDDQHAAGEQARALAESEGRFRVVAQELEYRAALQRAITDHAVAGFIMADATGRATYVNPAAASLTGFTLEEIEETSLHAALHHHHPDGRPYPAEECPLRIALGRGEPLVNTADHLIRKDGTFFPVVHSLVPLRRGGEVVGAVYEFRDVTEQRQVEQALEYENQLRRALTENAVSGLLLVDERGHTTYMNPAAMTILGFTLEELSTFTLHDAVHHSRPDGTRIAAEDCPYYKAFFRGEGLRNAWDWLVKKDGSFFPASVAATPLFRSGRLAGAVYEFHDVTEQHRAWEALREADRRKDQFLAILGHELRNPIGTIQNAMEVIARRPAPDLETERMRSIVLRQSGHLHRLVDDLLDVARVQTGKISLARTTVDLRDVASAVVDAARTAGRLASHPISVSTIAGPVVVEGDRARLEQLLGNFLDNAIKFTPPGKHIHIAVERGDARGIISVEDQGSGIDPDALTGLFQLFAQADQPIDRPLGGLGVGLALARAIAELHGGSVRAESGGLGHGSTFSVALPLAPAVAPPRPPARPAVAGRPRRILIIEDNADARAALSALLEEEGHAVTAFGSGREAVARLDDVAPDIAFIDLGLPEMDGYAVARALRGNGGRGVRLVALSGYGQPQDIENAAAAGFDAHITKPAGIEQLTAAIAAIDRAG